MLFSNGQLSVVGEETSPSHRLSNYHVEIRFINIMQKEWFADWFDSPYYHILYKRHDEADARAALDQLLRALQLAPGSRVLDLACGKGRHARYLADQGYDVTGLDISAQSISFAQQFAHERLHFYQHDMRLPFRINYYDAVVNFFTSFGYFETDRDHLRSLQNIAKGLKPGGLFLLDYFNSVVVRQQVVPEEHKVIDGLDFRVTKWVDALRVYKQVDVQQDGAHFTFQERVRLFEQRDCQELLQRAGLQVVQTYGNYQLEPFEVAHSPRLILIARKV